jgi:hypothetical protein
MISDILADALAEIQRYRSDPATAACYMSISDRLDYLQSVMDDVREARYDVR